MESQLKQKLLSLKNINCGFIKNISQNDKVPFVFISFCFFIFYTITGPKNIVSFADSLEMVTSSYFLTPAHPPGFSLYVIITKILTSSLFFIKDIYQRYVFITHLYSAITIFFISYGVSKISKDIKTGILAAVGFALTREFWIYSLLPEVFSLNNLIVALIFFFTVKFIEEKSEKSIIAAFFLIGLSLNNHWTACLMAAPIGLVMLISKTKFSVCKVFCDDT
jgi:hypothetical protein